MGFCTRNHREMSSKPPYVVLEEFKSSTSLFCIQFDSDPWDIHFLLTKQETS